jgi:hypothetical protein
MKYSRMLLVCALGAIILAPSVEAQNEARIVTFDITGAGTGAGQGTLPYAMAPNGEIAGWFLDSNNVGHGFVRTADGKIRAFDAPAAGTGAFQGTAPWSLNAAGTTAGLYVDVNCVEHGFVRGQDGELTAFDGPGAGTTPGFCVQLNAFVFQGTAGLDINGAGEIAGVIIDDNNVSHGFVRAKDGTITPFDAPGAGTGPFQGTMPAPVSGLNSAGVLTGTYFDANSAYHAFVRANDGTLMFFEVPGGGTGQYQGTYPTSINSRGQIIGLDFDSGNVQHGFLREADGSITTFDVAGAGAGPFQGTVPEQNNDAGLIVGNYVDANGTNHGFVRSPKGKISTFDVPGAGSGNFQGTVPVSLNAAGTITGYFTDANGVNHGFIVEAGDVCEL